MKHHVSLNDSVAAPAAVAGDRDYFDELGSILRGFGVPEEALPNAEAEMYSLLIRFCAERWRELAHCLPNTPHARALRIAVMGTEDRTFESHAAEVGTTRGNLHRGVARMRRHIARVTKSDNAALFCEDVRHRP